MALPFHLSDANEHGRLKMNKPLTSYSGERLLISIDQTGYTGLKYESLTWKIIACRVMAISLCVAIFIISLILKFFLDVRLRNEYSEYDFNCTDVVRTNMTDGLICRTI